MSAGEWEGKEKKDDSNTNQTELKQWPTTGKIKAKRKLNELKCEGPCQNVLRKITKYKFHWFQQKPHHQHHLFGHVFYSHFWDTMMLMPFHYLYTYQLWSWIATIC